MSRRDVTCLGLALVAVVAAGAIYLGVGRGQEEETSSDFPEGHAYICLDCGKVTVLTHAELLDFKARAREAQSPDALKVPCRECGSTNMVSALKCPHCGEYFERPGPGRPVCPHCKKPFPSLFEEGG